MPTPESTRVLYLRGVPVALAQKLKAAAALDGHSLQVYMLTLLKAHVAELERTGRLPKAK
jgi:hypothetical protein